MQTKAQTNATNANAESEIEDLRRLAQSVADRLCREVIAVKGALQRRACCIEWAYDCPFHCTAEVEKALMLPERLRMLRLRLAAVLQAQKRRT